MARTKPGKGEKMAEPKVLVAGCSAAVRRLVLKRLEEAGLALAGEWTQEDGARQLGGGHGGDVVLVDRPFLELSGWSRPQEGDQGVPVIVIAEEDGHTDWFVEAGRRGASDYLAVPFAAEHLKQKMERVLGTDARRMRDIYGTSNLEELYNRAHPRLLAQEEIDALLSASDPDEGEDALSAAMEGAAANDGSGPPEERAEDDTAERAAPEGRDESAPGGILFEAAERPVSVADSGRITTSYDFKHPARVNKQQLRTLENLHDQFARFLSYSLSSICRAVVDVDTAFVDQTTYGEFIMSLSNPACSYQFTLNPTGGQAIMDWAMPIVFGMVDRAHGGKGSSKGVEARQMTQIEFGVMAKAVKRAVADLERIWAPIVEVEISDIELETNPEFMQITAASEIIILLAFEVNATNMSGLISLCYPFFTLEPLLPLLGGRGPNSAPRRGGAERRPLNRLRLGDMDLDLAAELGRTRIPAGEAVDLAPGDVIRLDTRTDRPARVFVGGQPKFLAWPFEEDGDVKLRLAGKIPRHLAEKYGTVETD